MEDETENETEIKKPKLTRNELLAKARQAKKDKAEARAKESNNIVDGEHLIIKVNNLNINNNDNNDIPLPPKPEPFKKKATPKPKPKQEIKEFETKKDIREPEIIEEVVRVPGNRHKKIVKRTIEIEESETDEEIIEEIVKIPKIKKELKISRDEMKKKLIENNKQRLYNDLFS